MCDENTANKHKKYLRRHTSLSRRQFGQLTAGAVLAAMLPLPANARDVIDSEVTVPTPDGEADCYFVHPVSGRHPAILVWPDALGLRPAFREMGKRLARAGYAVLVVNPYYRSARAPVVAEGARWRDESVRATIMPLVRELSAHTHVTDARAFVEFLDRQQAVNSDRQIGTIGYCMGGPIVMRTAAALPGRIGAVGSFHGGGLVTGEDDSPHLQIPAMRAHFLIAIAEDDHEQDPEAKNVLIESFAKANLPAEIEVYEGAMHGWCVVDSPVYHHEQAERAWHRMLRMFETALG